jgi:hypothetical protein
VALRRLYDQVQYIITEERRGQGGTLLGFTHMKLKGLVDAVSTEGESDEDPLPALNPPPLSPYSFVHTPYEFLFIMQLYRLGVCN